MNDAASLAWFANLGCIEIHTWHSRIGAIERPDYLLIDLDPSADGQWPHVREIALVVKEVMDELGLRSYPKTSGATGMHILAPIERDLEFPEVRRFAKAMAKEVDVVPVFRYANVSPAAIALVAAGRVDVKGLITHRFPLEEAERALQLSDRREDGVVKALVEVG